MTSDDRDWLGTSVLVIGAAGLFGGLLFWWWGDDATATMIWRIGVVPVLAALLFEIVRSLARGEVGLDIVAALSMSAALLTGETLAAAVVAVMYAGGNFLESYAEGRARRAMHELLARVPRFATRHRNGGLEEVPLDDVRPGDRLLIRQGDVVPVDGTVASATAFVDTSALTGESLPVRLSDGGAAMSGSTNAGEAFDLVATRLAKESTYAGIVRLVEEAQQSKAPMSRLADRWSLGFLAVTVALAAATWWLTADHIRAVAVLVVATPCPLILAVPVALVAGLSRAASFGVLIKGAKFLENMARIRTLVLDKTGTLTEGRPQIARIDSRRGLEEREILRLAAALDQASQHPIAQAIVSEAKAKGLALPVPTEISEFPGEGVAGLVEGRRVVVGGDGFVARHAGHPPGDHVATSAGSVLVAVAVDGHLAGYILMADSLRGGAPRLLTAIRQNGVERILLATGDRRDVAEHVAASLKLDGVHADLTPDQKVLLVLSERKNGPVMMVGDGVNDAPALASADVGVAMGARGAAASVEAADVVLLVDHIDRLAPGMEIARGARRIAIESVVAGIGLSLLGMIAASLGYLTPVQGALLQEAIDVAVILNALRVLGITPRFKPEPLAVSPAAVAN